MNPERITRLIANQRWQEAETAIAEYLDGPCPIESLAAFQALQDYVVRPRAEASKPSAFWAWLTRRGVRT